MPVDASRGHHDGLSISAPAAAIVSAIMNRTPLGIDAGADSSAGIGQPPDDIETGPRCEGTPWT